MNNGKDLVAASATPLVLAIAAAVAIKLPELLGFHISAPSTDTSFYVRNFSLFVLPLLAVNIFPFDS